ncbi:MAG: hypothetical protein P1U72_08715 [Paracoccaceae bacterium]|nr:hypothetical protein [Paracoccaceae bacterium]
MTAASRGRFQIMCLIAPLILLLAGCAPAPPPPAPAAGPLPEVVARFETPPARLVTALERLCTTPAQRITRPAAGVIECRMLLGPEATAGAILRYDGTVERLPESVVRLRVTEDAQGYLLASAAYLEVPRAAGDVLRVVFPDPAMDRRMARVLEKLGGTLQ